jgi:plastocyanin
MAVTLPSVPMRNTPLKGISFSGASSNRKGTFRYVCTLHSSMKMTVKVS